MRVLFRNRKINKRNQLKGFGRRGLKVRTVRGAENVNFPHRHFETTDFLNSLT